MVGDHTERNERLFLDTTGELLGSGFFGKLTVGVRVLAGDFSLFIIPAALFGASRGVCISGLHTDYRRRTRVQALAP